MASKYPNPDRYLFVSIYLINIKKTNWRIFLLKSIYGCIIFICHDANKNRDSHSLITSFVTFIYILIRNIIYM
jgi:hypothetical protein